MTDYNDTYQNLFYLIKNHKYDDFIREFESIDETDIMFDINKTDEQNNYFLTYACILNQPKIIRLLIDKGAKIDIVDKYDMSILLVPITYSFDEVLKLLLEENKKSIGISITDISDRNLRTPLHYAIEMKNINSIKLLLEYGANPNSTDKDGLNSLHLAVKSRSFIICELILAKIGDINSRYNTGESSLHIACNLQLVDIAQLLIEKGINVNSQDHSHEITPLHYSVLLNNRELTALLLKHNASPNVQDIYGNTPLHYAIIENNFEIFMMLTQSSYTKNIINLNMWNIDGEIPLHIVLKKSDETVEDYADIIIEKSNLSLQDINGDTCINYIINLDLWRKYKEILSKKRLDIFSLNSQKKMPIDYVKDEDFNDFLNMVVESYIYRLQSANELWYDEWENICSKSLDNITEKEKNMILKISGNAKFDGSCGSIIKNKLMDLINRVKKNKELKCYERSYPVRKSIVCVSIDEGRGNDHTTFTGSTLDILIGLLFLLKKHKNACSSLSKNFSQNKELCAFYKSIGILMNTKCEFLNFEIVWVHQRLYLMEEFYEQIKRCVISKKKFIIIPIGIEMREGSHAGYLIYDTQNNEVERFEPHGSTTPAGLYYNPSLLDEILEARFKTINENIKYIKPSDYLPKIGFQLMDIGENKKRKIGDPLGFCALWCIWYVDMRLTYKDITRENLIKILVKTIRSQNISFRNMIRNYGKNITIARDLILKKSNMDINDWLNDQYTDVQINSVMNNLNSEILQVASS